MKNPRSGRWVRYEKGIAQRLRRAAEDGAPVMEEDADKGKRARSPSPPPKVPQRPRPRPRVKKAKVSRSPSPEIPSLLPKKLGSPKPADGARLEKIVEELVEKKMKEKKAEEEKRSQHKWRVASTAVRASVRLQGGAPQYEALDSAQSQSQHTGLTLDFSDFGVDDE